jgi:hypothetical protein
MGAAHWLRDMGAASTVHWQRDMGAAPTVHWQSDMGAPTIPTRGLHCVL